jgi:hypothetical protein
VRVLALFGATAQSALAAKVVTVSQTINVAANTIGVATAECPKRKRLVGGGFESAATASTGAATLETRAGSRAWTAVAIGAVDAGGRSRSTPIAAREHPSSRKPRRP